MKNLSKKADLLIIVLAVVFLSTACSSAVPADGPAENVSAKKTENDAGIDRGGQISSPGDGCFGTKCGRL